MKYLFTFLLFFTISLSFGQEISPYYPAKESSLKKTSQWTFFEFNFVSNKIQEYINENYSLINDDLIVGDDSNTFILTFQERISFNSKPKELKFHFNTFVLEDKDVITDAYITGDKESLILFFVFYWGVKINTNSTKEIAEITYQQDKISFIKDKNNYLISIKNNTINDKNKFINDFIEKKKIHINKSNNLSKTNTKNTVQKKETLFNSSSEYFVQIKKKSTTIKPIGSFAFPYGLEDKQTVEKRILDNIENIEIGSYKITLYYTYSENRSLKNIKLEIINMKNHNKTILENILK